MEDNINRIINILDMLDWHSPIETQSKGRTVAKELGTIKYFIQPLTPRHNKNIWENCALIIANECDEKLKPFLIELLEWLQDMNWPGASCILHRLQHYSDYAALQTAINTCMKRADYVKLYNANQQLELIDQWLNSGKIQFEDLKPGQMKAVLNYREKKSRSSQSS